MTSVVGRQARLALSRLDLLDRWLAGLRALALAGSAAWWILHPLDPVARWKLGWLFGGFALSSAVLFLAQLRQPAWLPRLYRIAMVHDLLFIVMLVRTTGGLHSNFYLAYYLWIALHAYYFGLLTGVAAGVGASASYLLAGLGLPGIEPSDLGLRIAFFLLVGVCMGAVAERERRKHQLVGQLHRQILAEHDRLVAAQERLVHSDRLATVGELAATLAHELRNPLAGISGALYVLADRSASDHEQQVLLEEIQVNIGRMNKALNDLLFHARPPRPQYLPLDVNEVVDHSLWFLSSRPGTGIEVLRRFEPDLPPVRLDPSLLHQAFLNILLNAQQAMPDGGRLTVATRHVPGSPRKPSTVEVQITDEGVGISAEHLPHIFQPFFTTKAQGTGLGLAIAARIVEQHGGCIAAESEPGTPTTFRVRLPTTSADPAGRLSDGLETARR